MPKPIGQAILVMLAGGPTIAMVPDPSNPSRYMRTDPSVLYVPCPYCHAKRGIPCIGKQVAHLTSTHYFRRDAAQKAKSEGAVLSVPIGHGARILLKDLELDESEPSWEDEA